MDKGYYISLKAMNELIEMPKEDIMAILKEISIDNSSEKKKGIKSVVLAYLDKYGGKEILIHGKSIGKKTIEERSKEFYDKLKPFLKDYKPELLREFYDYWTEHNDDGFKMRFEKESTFQISKRLATFKRNEAKFNKNSQDVKPEIVTNKHPDLE